MLLKWLHSLATAISGKTGRLDRLNAATLMAVDEDLRDGEAPAPNVNPLEELEHLLNALRGGARSPRP